MTQTKAELLETKHQGDIRLGDANSSHYVGFKAPATVGSNLVWTLPATDGSANQFLQTNASGVLGWGTADVSSAMPLSGGTFTGDVTFSGAAHNVVWDKSDNALEFGDAAKLKLGSDDDISIHHTGGYNYIEGALRIGKNNDVRITDANDDTRLQVTNTGIAVTGTATISGNLTVSGTTTTVDSVTLSVKDKNIEMGVVSSPSDTTADGGGITLKGASDKTFNWVNATDAWTSSEHIHLLDNKKLLVGTDSDLEIFHNGSHSLLNDSGTGNIRFQLGGSTKLEVQSGGINVTGAINVNGSALSTAPQLTGTASGAITAGDRVIVNTNGTVSKVAINVTPNNQTQITASLSATNRSTSSEMSGQWDEFHFGYDTQYGTLLLGTSSIGGSHEFKLRTISYSGNFPVLSSVLFNFNSGQRITEIGGIVEDPNQNKHICFYATNNDYSNPYCKGAVVTMTSATAGSAGSAINFSASGDYFSPWGCFDTNVNKFITIYTTSSGATKARACYINGTSITTHTEVTVHDGTGRTSGDKSRVVFDSTNNKTVCVYAVGSTIKAKVITCASNGTLTVGSEVAMTGSGDYPMVAFSPEHGKIAVSYRKPSNGYRVMCGTVSGTSISFGNQFDFASLTTNDITHRIRYSAGSKKFIVMYRDDNSKLQGKVLTLSGTTFSVHAPLVGPNGSSAGLSANQAIRYGVNDTFDFMYDATKDRVAYIYSDDGATGPYYTQSFADGVSATNLTSENYIGIAAASASDSASATIDVSGATNSNQSSLTAGQKYYVQNDGTLGLTAASPAVFAGTAVSATKLIVNDQQPVPTSVWEVLSTHDFGTTAASQVIQRGWTNANYQQFKLCWSDLTGGANNTYREFFLEWYISTSDSAQGTLYNADPYYQYFAQRGSYTGTGISGSKNSQRQWRLNNGSGMRWTSGEIIFPVTTFNGGGYRPIMAWGRVSSETGNDYCGCNLAHPMSSNEFLNGVKVYSNGNWTTGRLTWYGLKHS